MLVEFIAVVLHTVSYFFMFMYILLDCYSCIHVQPFIIEHAVVYSQYYNYVTLYSVYL